MRPLTLALPALLLTLALPATAQERGRPDGWISRFDRGQEGAGMLVAMPPGWHLNPGPSGIHYHPDRTASGNFRIASESFLFPDSRPREAYGVFFGGRDLDGPNQAYSYFLVRGDGSFLVKRRDGAETSTVVEWTSHDAIVPLQSDGQAKNTLAVEAGTDAVDFFINGTKVTSVPRDRLLVNGVVGLRVNHGLNIHVTNLTVTSK